jgi:hypothetical protein
MAKKPCCSYCLESDVKLAKLYDWENPEKYEWYCQEHWYAVRDFEEEQKERFTSYYSDEARKKSVSEEGLKLWERLTK